VTVEDNKRLVELAAVEVVAGGNLAAVNVDRAGDVAGETQDFGAKS
jgi:hypothetical protein